MILSHRHKFIFIKGMKVAGTSAEIALSQICGPEDIVTPITRVDERARLGKGGEPRNYTSWIYPSFLRRWLERQFVASVIRDSPGNTLINRAHRYRFINHMDLQTVLRLVPEAAHYEVLCVERSPYAKVMSLANWVDHHQSYGKGAELPNRPARLVEAVDRLIRDGSITRVLNVERYRNADGRVTAKPWKTESLASDMARFFKSGGVEPVELVTAKRGANADSIDPAAALRPDQIALINELFAEEFELFGWPMIGELPDTRA
jgi:hypothetical protein